MPSLEKPYDLYGADNAQRRYLASQNSIPVYGGDETHTDAGAANNTANLPSALNGAAQAEEMRPGSGAAARILGLHQRLISELQDRVSRVEATK